MYIYVKFNVLKYIQFNGGDKMKKFIAILLASTSVFASSTSAFAEETKSIDITKAVSIKEAKKNKIEIPANLTLDKRQNLVINGEKVDLKEGAIVYQDRLFLPVRELGDALDVEVGYVAEQKIVALDNGSIQLPVGENKAVVNGEIVAIDKNNDKVGTLVVNGKTYLPVSFVASSLKTKVSDLFYHPETKTTAINTFDYKGSSTQTTETAQKLSKEDAVKAYSDIIKASNEMKNATSHSKSEIKFKISDGTTAVDMNMVTDGSVYMDVKDKVNMYAEQKSTVELIGEKQTVEQKMFYKDGKVYVSQKMDDEELKYTLDLNLEEFMKLSNSLNLNETFTESMVLEGEVKNITDKNQKQYTFTMDMSKAVDLVSQFTEELTLAKEDLEALDSLKLDNVKYTIVVNDKNQPISQDMKFDMSLKSEGFYVDANVYVYNTYENIGTTVVKTPNEDLSTYESFEDVVENAK